MYKKSFLKWAGGKFKLLEHIIPETEGYDKFVEPFSGSGVISLNVNCEYILLNDINKDLINTFMCLQNKRNQFINDCKQYFTEEFNTKDSMYEKSILFIYLNRHCYNGLCRYSKKSGFNVPFGKYKKPYFPEKELKLFMDKYIEFCSRDFRELFINDEKTVMYIDPPYAPIDQKTNFTGYTEGKFELKEQEELAEFVKNTDCKCIVSNHDTEYVRELYKDCIFKEIQVNRNINSKGDERKKVGELIILNRV
jgi:DNA adenine methylase